MMVKFINLCRGMVMKKNIIIFSVLMFMLILPGLAVAVQKTVTIDWTIGDTTEIVGYKMYYSSNSDMAGKLLACQTGDANATSLTCEGVEVTVYPLYFTIASVTLADEFESTSFVVDLTPLQVQNFVVISEGGEPPSTSISITNLSPASYQAVELFPGDQYYVDRSYTIITMSTGLEGLMGIKTANNDKLNSSEEFITFDIDKAGTVYVAYDSRSTTYPLWLTSAFTDTGLSILTDDCLLSVWQKNVAAGHVVLPGNAYGGAPPGMGSNYLVLVAAQ